MRYSRLPRAGFLFLAFSQTMALPVNRMIAAVVTALVLTLSTARAQSPEGSTADDTARLLAGLPPSSNSPLAVLTKNPAWLSHARYFD